MVLDGRDGALGPPVHGIRDVIEADVGVPEPCRRPPALAAGRLVTGPGGPELVVGEVGELVGLQPELMVPGVDGLDEGDVGLEHLEPPRLLGGVSVDAAVLGHPLLVLGHYGLVISEVARRHGTERAGAGEGSGGEEESRRRATSSHGARQEC